MAIPQKGPVQARAVLDCLAQFDCGYTLTASTDLHEDLMGRTIGTHDHCQAGYAFATDDTDLDAAIASNVRNHRRNAALDEIHVLNRLVANFQLFPKRQVD